MRPTLLTMVVGVAVLLMAAPNAVAGDTKCTGNLTATYGNIVVPAGANCSLSGARVRGSVDVRNGATLSISSRPEGSGGFGLANPTVIDGNVQAENARRVSMFGSEVRGNVQLKGGSEGASFFFARVRGNLQIEGMAGGLSMSFSGVYGGLEVTKTSGGIQLVFSVIAGSVKLIDNVVPNTAPFTFGMWVEMLQTSGDVQVLNNSGPGTKRITSNVVGGTLQCFVNAASFVGAPNAAGKREGQCV